MELINTNHILIDQGIMVLVYVGFFSKGKFLNFTQSYAKIMVLFSNFKQQKLMSEQSVTELSGI